jgi:superoxide dismutase, Fe-Mn family
MRVFPANHKRSDAVADYTLPPLPYDHGALEPHIDAKTMEIHHGKHHAAYVNNLNAALKDHPDHQGKTIEALIADLNALPDGIRAAVRNNGGGHANHSMFWELMAKGAGGQPSGPVADAIKKTFGDFAAFQGKFKEAALGRFGSGWAWVVHADNMLRIVSTPNQDNPLMEGQAPILGLDVWEHAYYLKYQNKRADYVDAWWNVVNWNVVAKRYADAKAGK